MTEPSEYFVNKRPDKTYVSKRIRFVSAEGSSAPTMRIASKVFDPAESFSFIQEGGELVLRVTPGEREEIVARFFEDDRKIFRLVIQKFVRSTGRPQRVYFSFSGQEIHKLLESEEYPEYSFPNDDKINITDRELQRILSTGQLNHLFQENQDAVVALLSSQVTKSDVVALGYRKEQLERFRKLLFEPSFFESESQRVGGSGERVWQQFFEANKWVFGYGLTYLFLSSLDERKLEQMVAGSDLLERGKRADAILKSKGAVEALCLVEIKKHSTPLLKTSQYRPGCWAPSDELAGGVAQAQVTVDLTMKKVIDKLEPTSKDGDPTGEQIFSYEPRSVLVIGSLGEFQDRSRRKYREIPIVRTISAPYGKARRGDFR